MDKYEYKLKTEEMLELMEKGAYSKAAETADQIDWRKVRNVGMLMNVSDIYEKSGEYDKSYEVLNIAYHRAEGSRKVIYRLCSLALKTGNVDEAIDFYDDFMQIAPKDPNQYILRYQILRAQRAPVEQQIEALEEFKKSEYIEEWAYELAKLYQEAGMTAECLEECDDLILWFSEGQYVYKAMELKMQYKPLTPSQQEKYDHRYEKFSAETEEIPSIVAAYAQKEEPEENSENSAEDSTEEPEFISEESEEIQDIPEEKGEVQNLTLDEEPDQKMDTDKEPEAPKKKKLGDTMPLGEALRKLLRPDKTDDGVSPESNSSEDNVTGKIAVEETEEDMTDLEDAIGAIESVADLDMISQLADEKAARETEESRKISISGEMKEIIPEPEESREQSSEEKIPEEGSEEMEAFLEEANAESIESRDTDQIEGQISLEDILDGWNSAGASEEVEGTEEGEKEALSGEIDEEETVVAVGEVLEQKKEEDGCEAVETEDTEESERVKEVEEEDGEEDRTEGVNMTENKTEPILPPDIQRMIDEIEGVIPPQEEKPKKPEPVKEQPEEPRENMGKLAEDLRIDDDDELDEEYWEDEVFDDGEDLTEEDVEDFTEEEELPEEEEIEELPEEEIEDFAEEEEFPEEEKIEDFTEEEELPEEVEDFMEEDLLGEAEEFLDEEETADFPEGEEIIEEDEIEELSEEDEEELPDFEEEFRVNPEHSAELDDREIPDEDDGMDIMSATTPLSRKETAKLIATGKTAPLPLNEISDALSMSDTGFIVHGRYDLAMQSGIGTRAGLTEEQKKLFSYFVPVRGMSEQLVDVLEQDKNCTNREGTSRTGNLLIIGNKGNGKTVLAVDVVKAIQKQRNIRQGKVAIVTGESLNKKKIGDIFDKLYGGALIIEKAGKMNEKTVARLNKAMERDTGEMLIVLEEQRKPLDRLLSSNREFRRKFTCRLEVPIFINDELVTFGQTYAQENGYRIDEMGILALYSKIDSLQREDHAVTVAEVKEVMDDAIRHSQKASAKKLVKKVLGRNTDEADRILLSEKDFHI